MNKTLIVLVGLALLLAPAIPSLAQTSGDEGDGAQAASSCEETEAFQGEYYSLTVDPDLPGATDLSLSESNATIANQIQLAGDDLACELDDDRVRMSTNSSALIVEDDEDLRFAIEAEENATVQIHLAEDLTIEDVSDSEEDEDDEEARYRLTPDSGRALLLTGENLTIEDDTLIVAGDARALAAEEEGEDADRPAGAQGERGDNRSAAADRGRSASSDDEDDDDRRERQRQQVTTGDYEIGPLSLALDNDTVQDLRLRNTTLFTSVQMPGLSPAEERRQGPHLELRGDDARLRLSATGGMMARLEAEAGVQATVGPDVEIEEREEHLVLSTDDAVVVVQGEDIELEDRQLEAEKLQLNARADQHHEGPVWEDEDDGEDEPGTRAASLPHVFEGRHVSFMLAEDGVRNLSIHGTPVGEIGFDPVTIEEIKKRGAHFEAEGEDVELRVQDTPAVQLRLEAENLDTDELANETVLASGARVTVDIEDDELRLRVDRPAGVLSNRTLVEHRPASEPVERSEGPAPGLQTRTEQGSFGVQSTDANSIQASFDSSDETAPGNVSIELDLTRAMLIDDANGNGLVDVGEPALAQRPLTSGAVSIEDDMLVHRFPLWSGTLTATVEPGDETAKITYTADNLSAPPGTLFVLETELDAPDDANLTPTDTGVFVENGTASAEYSATGPVTVDGEEAWAQRSIFVDNNDTVRVLLAYPAGDEIVHDPTLAVQTMGAGEVVERLVASPYAVLVGAGVAGLLVAVTVWQRQRHRP